MQTTDRDDIIRAEGLKMVFRSPAGERVGVGTDPEGLSFTVRRGEIFGIIGPDGAGKSTLFRILCSLIRPQSGTAIVDGCDVVRDYRELRRHIGYMPGTFSLYGDLSVRENLDFYATLFGTSVEENYHLVREIYSQIEPFEDRMAANLSGGMKQKLALSCALIHKPHVLFLDEPTTGIDPISRQDLWRMLRRLAGEGVTVVASTAYMDEASYCERVAFMRQGRFVALDTPEHLVERYPLPVYRLESDDRIHALETLEACPEVLHVYAFGDSFHITLREGADEEALMRYVAADPRLSANTPVLTEPTLEDAFLLLSDDTPHE